MDASDTVVSFTESIPAGKATTLAQDHESQRDITNALLAARDQNDLPAMIAHAELLMSRFPKAVAGYQIGALALRETGQLERAASVVAAAASFFDDKAWLLTERIRLAQQVGDWRGAAEQAEMMRERFPDQVAGWRMGANALRQQGRIEEAAAVLLAVPRRFAGEEWVLVALTLLAVERDAWVEAGARAAALRAAFPDNELGYRTGLRSLRRQSRFEEASVLLGQAEQACAGKLWLLAEAAGLAQGRGDHLGAIQRWREVREVMPDEARGYVGGFQSNLALGRVAAADALRQQAEARFPPAAWIMAQTAEVAAAHGLFEEAAQHWAAVRAAFPDRPEGYHGGYRTFRKSGKLDASEAVLEELLLRLPNDRWALVESALVAEARYDYDAVDRRWQRATETLPDDPELALKFALARSVDRTLRNRDWPTTVARLRTLNERLPHYMPGWQAHIKTLRFIGSLAEAERMAEECLRRMPGEPELWLEYALTTGEGASEVAAGRLAEAAAQFPGHARVQSEFGIVLGRLGRLDEAAQQYQQALERFPESANLLCGYAVIAMRQQDWPEALRRWQAVQARFPEDARAVTGLVDTMAALGSEAAAPAAPAGTAGRSERAEMFWQFESLGGSGQACEFGFVQRAGGAEPLGLLRWTHIEPAYLLEALVSRFDGVGTPEQTIVDFYIGEDPDNPEYRYNDTRLKMRMHTFIRKIDMPAEQMFEQTCRRMAYLRSNLIQDLEDGDKIFVYKIYERNLEEQELAQLHKAMRSYGNNTLLYVQYADEAHPSGTVVQAGDGLFVGYISGFNINPTTHKLRPPDQPAWEAICRTAFDLHQHQRSAQSDAH